MKKQPSSVESDIAADAQATHRTVLAFKEANDRLHEGLIKLNAASAVYCSIASALSVSWLNVRFNVFVNPAELTFPDAEELRELVEECKDARRARDSAAAELSREFGLLMGPCCSAHA